jgi:hypothetical protein
MFLFVYDMRVIIFYIKEEIWDHPCLSLLNEEPFGYFDSSLRISIYPLHTPKYHIISKEDNKKEHVRYVFYYLTNSKILTAYDTIIDVRTNHFTYPL